MKTTLSSEKKSKKTAKIGELPRVTLRLREETINYVMEKQNELRQASPQQTILELIRRAESTDELKKAYTRIVNLQSSALGKRISSLEEKSGKQSWEIRSLRKLEAETEANTENIRQLRTELEELKLQITVNLAEFLLANHELADNHSGRPKTRPGSRGRPVAKKAAVGAAAAVADEKVPYCAEEKSTKDDDDDKKSREEKEEV
ncbi:MAG: hypothetical protein Q4Q20_04580 [Methanocorpusculum sp.]|nr:hypothetical protein [Methanocorpusculum sp.]